MKITAIRVEGFLGIDLVEILPGDRNLLLIGGKNEAGKTSLLRAIETALRAKDAPEEPVKRGKRRADIRLDLGDDPVLEDLIVHRRFSRSNKMTLEVTGKDGLKKAGPQKLLDKLVGARFLDPIKFIRLPEKKQRDMLLGCVDIGIDLDENAVARKNAYAERTIVNRDVKRLSAELAASPKPDTIPEPVDTDAIMGQLDLLGSTEKEAITADYTVEEIDRTQADYDRDVRDATLKVEKLRTELAELEEEASGCAKGANRNRDAQSERRELAVMASKVDVSDETAAARARLAAASDANEARAALVAQGARHITAASALASAEGAALALTDKIADLDDAKTEALAAATMPIAGLSVDGEQVIYRDLPLSQASGARKLQVSLAIAAALSPQLRDIWVTSGEKLDMDSLELVRTFAEENDLRIWLERVGTSDDDAIIISDGAVQTR